MDKGLISRGNWMGGWKLIKLIADSGRLKFEESQ